MGDFFRKIPSLVKSKKSNSSSPRSTTPSPPLLPPSSPPQNIPVPHDTPTPFEIDLLPLPPFIKGVDSSDAPLPSTSPPPAVLTQGVVTQRDQAARVFQPSPLRRQPITPAQLQQQRDRIEGQRARYRLKNKSTVARNGLSSRSSSPIEDKNKGREQAFTPSLFPDTPPKTEEAGVKKQRSGPATTFAEILGIDGSIGVPVDLVSFPKIPDDFAVSSSGPPAQELGETSGLHYTGRSLRIPAIDISPYLIGLDFVDGDDSTVKSCQPLLRNESLAFLLSATVETEITDSNEVDFIPARSLQKTRRGAVYTEDNPKLMHQQSGDGFGLTQESKAESSNRSLCMPSQSPTPGTEDLVPEETLYGNSLESGPSIPQFDGNATFQSQGQIESPSAPDEPLNREDPFGIQPSIPTHDVIILAEQGRRVPFLQRLKECLKCGAKNIKNRTTHAFTTGPKFDKDINTDMVHLEEPGEAEEDMGTRKAKAVARSWNRADLVACYVLLVLLMAYFGLGSVHSVLIITQAVNDWAMRAEVKYYQFELVLSMIGVTRILGIMTFAKLANTYSRPCSLFVAVMFAVGGIGTSAFAVTWETFGAGHALFHFGRSGALVVAQVIVADTSDLGWRGAFTWGLEIGFIFWIWTKPVVERLVIEKLGWHVPIWIFFSFAFPAAIPALIATYVFHRRASHWGFFPASRNIHHQAWWTPKGFWKRVKLFSVEYDCLGMLLWIIGVGLLTTALSVSEKMQVGIGIWMMVLLLGGSLGIILLVIWEVWLNTGLREANVYGRREIRRFENLTQQGDRPTEVSWNVLPGERTTMPGPAGYDSVSVDRVTAQLAARIVALQEPGGLMYRRAGFGACRKKSHPLFRARLLKRRTIPLGCLIGFLANFATKIGVWSVWDRPESLPAEYRELIEFVQGKNLLIQFTSLIVAGLSAGFLIRITKFFKRFVITGLLVMLGGLLTFHYTNIYIISQGQIIVSQTMTGLGAGMVWIGLMVGVQASCKKHSDVAISIGLLTTFSATGEMTAEAMKRLMQTYLLNLLPLESSQEDFTRALNGHWGVMLLIAVAATVFALVLAGVGLASHNLDEVKQHVSGVVFGTDDAKRQSGDEEHPSWETPSLFIPNPEDENLRPQGPPPSPPDIGLNSIQAVTEYGTVPLPSTDQQSKAVSPQTSGSPSATDFASPQARNPPTGTRGHESTADWETTASESNVSESRITSDSRTIRSPAQVLSSYVDGVFIMDSDMEQTPRAASRINDSYEYTSGDLAISPRTNTMMRRGPSTIRRRNSRSQSITGSNIVTGSSMAGAQQQFSFQKRQIKAANVARVRSSKTGVEEKSAWSDSSGEECLSNASINSFSGDSNQLSAEMTDPISDFQSSDIGLEWKILDHYGHEEYQGSGPQLNFSSDSIAAPFESFSGFNSGSGQAPPDLDVPATTEDIVMAFDGAEIADNGQRHSEIEDGRVSRFSYRTQAEWEELDLTSVPSFANTSQLNVAEITSKVDALTEKNSYSPEQILSPIMELSPQGSLEHVIAPLDGSLGSDDQSSLRVPIIIGLLPPNRYQDREVLEEAPNFGELSTVVVARAKRKGEEGKKYCQ